MGAIPYETGVTFRVWAPNASAVSVVGNFNNWNPAANPMARQGDNWSTDVEGIAAGAQYKYHITHNGQALWRNDPRAFQVTNSGPEGVSVVADMDYEWTSDFTMPGWNQLVLYQMHIGTFNDTPGGRPGTFNSAVERLDHVRDLGANAVVVMPPYEFAGDFSWGYNPAYPFAPESVYGTPRELMRFVDEAHKRGLAVLFDVVHNHYGPQDLPMWCFDGPCYDAGGIYFYTDWRRSTPWGDTRPDYGRGEVRLYIKDSIFHWLDRYRVDGMRWDSTGNIYANDNGRGAEIADGRTLLQWIMGEVNVYQPWKIMIAEDFTDRDWISQDPIGGGLGFDSQWDGAFVHPVRDAIIPPSDSARNMFSVADAINHNFNGQMTHRVIYTESHDEVANGRQRVPSEIWNDNPGSWFSRKRSTLGAALTFSSPGIPMIFQGQELLEDGWFQDTDPVDWSKAETYGGITNLYRDLMRLRRNWYDNTRGLRGNNVNVYHVNNDGKVIAYHRWDQGGAGDDVVILANFSINTYTNYQVGLPRGGTWYTVFNSDSTLYASDYTNFGYTQVDANGPAMHGLGQSAGINIGAYSAVFLSQRGTPPPTPTPTPSPSPSPSATATPSPSPTLVPVTYPDLMILY